MIESILNNAAPWLILAAVLLYGVVHSILASLWAKAQAERWLGDLANRGYRIAYNIFAVLSFLPVLALVAGLPDRDIYTIPYPWVLLTLAVQLLAGLVIGLGVFQTRVWSFLGLRQLAGTTDGREPELVVGGLYRWVRHPLYSAGLVFIWLAPQMTWNILALNTGLSLYLWTGALIEERKLFVKFGQAYRLYRKRTPMLIPRMVQHK